jgi:hypothetical protein
MKISQECKDYESHALRCRSKPPFPIEPAELLTYIRYRARNKTFCKYMSNLERHPLHGYRWLHVMNNNPLIKKEMKDFIKFWDVNLAEYKYPLLGVNYNTEQKLSVASLPRIAMEQQQQKSSASTLPPVNFEVVPRERGKFVAKIDL